LRALPARLWHYPSSFPSTGSTVCHRPVPALLRRTSLLQRRIIGRFQIDTFDLGNELAVLFAGLLDCFPFGIRPKALPARLSRFLARKSQQVDEFVLRFLGVRGIPV